MARRRSFNRASPPEGLLSHEKPELPAITEQLVDYPEPPERMHEFVTGTYPEIGETVSELSGRELSVLCFCLLERYRNRGRRHSQRTAHYRSVKDYLGLYQTAEPRSEIRHGADVETALDRVRETIRGYNRPQYAAALLDKVRATVQSGSLNDAFYVPTTLYRDDEWLEARGGYARQLFGSEATQTSTSEPAQPYESLAQLALQTSMLGGTAYEMANRATVRDTIYKGVSAILTTHQAKAAGAETGAAIFGLPDAKKDLEIVAALTARMIWLWERVWARHNKQKGVPAESNPSPFAAVSLGRIDLSDFKDPTVQLVVEAAAGAIEVLQLGYTAGKPESSYNEELADLVAQRGPAFVGAWACGDIIREHCDQQGLDAEEWLELLSPSTLAHLAVHHRKNPLQATEHLLDRYHQLNNDNLQAWTGWSEARVTEAFTPGDRLRIATSHPGGDLEGAVKDIVARLPTYEELAARLGWTAERAAETFSWSYLTRKALASPRYLKRLEQTAKRLDSPDFTYPSIARTLGRSELEAKQLFPPSALLHIAEKSGDPLTEFRRVAESHDLLSVKNLMETFSLSERQATASFPPYVRRELARKPNSLHAAKKMLQIADIIAKEYDLPARLIPELSLKYSLKGARKVAERITAEQARRPSAVNPKAWAWTVLRSPQATHTARLRYAAAYEAWTRLVYTKSLDAPPPANRRSRHETISDNQALDPAEIVIEQEPSHALERLQSLAKQAGIASEQLEALLDHFASGDATASPQLDAEIATLISRLRQAEES